MTGWTSSPRTSCPGTARGSTCRCCIIAASGKVGMHGADVWPAYLKGGLARIRDYCETDVLNTYLIYLRFELVRGHLNAAEHAHEIARVRALLNESTAEHPR